MPAKRLSMRKLKDVLRLQMEHGLTDRASSSCFPLSVTPPRLRFPLVSVALPGRLSRRRETTLLARDFRVASSTWVRVGSRSEGGSRVRPARVRCEKALRPDVEVECYRRQTTEKERVPQGKGSDKQGAEGLPRPAFTVGLGIGSRPDEGRGTGLGKWGQSGD